MLPSAREAYDEHGVDGWYAAHGAEYRNPHEDAIRAAIAHAVQTWQPTIARVLDLACGSGEATLALRELGAGNVHGVDPFTGNAYLARTGCTAEPLRFEDVASGALEERRYDLAVCSYALHLAPPSWLPATCMALARVSPALLVVTPHKRPEIRENWGWKLRSEAVIERVRVRLYDAIG